MFDKRVLSVFMSVVLVAGLCPVSAYARVTDEPGYSLESARVIVSGQEDAQTSGESGSCAWSIDSNGVLSIKPTEGSEGWLGGNGIVFDDEVKPLIRSAHFEGVVHSSDSSSYSTISFSGCENLESVDWRGYDASGNARLPSFSGCGSLREVDYSGLDFSNATGVDEYAFNGCNNLERIVFSGLNLPELENGRLNFSNLPALKSVDLSNMRMPKLTSMHSMFSGCAHLKDVDLDGLVVPNVSDASGMFYGCSQLEYVDLSFLRQAKLTDLGSLFSGCSSLTNVNLSGLDTSSVSDMRYMFDGCSSLASFDFGALDTSSVTSMDRMFSDCASLVHADLSRKSAPSLQTVSRMFAGCASLRDADLSWFNAPMLTDLEYLFDGCSSLQTVDLSDSNLRSVTSCNGIFNDCASLQNARLSRADLRMLETLRGMFSGCEALRGVSLSGLHADSVLDASYMFSGCALLSNVELDGIDAPDLANLNHMFYGCSKLGTIDLSSLVTSSARDVSYLLSGCDSLEFVDLSGVKAPHMADMSYLFSGCDYLEGVNLAGFEVLGAASLRGMFSDCISLRSIGLEGFRTDGATDMSGMFSGCRSLKKLDLSGLDTSNVKDMSSMFSYCASLTALDLSSFDTTSVSEMARMFSGCESLATLDISKFVAPELKSVDWMFNGCAALKSVDMSRLGTSNDVSDFSYMFSGCKSLEFLDLTRFDTSKALNMRWMFWNCSSLKSIRVSNLWSTRRLVYSDYMFYQCSSLVGGAGTPFDRNHVDEEYARIDTAGAPGYLTFGGAGTSLAGADVVLMQSSYAYTGADVAPKPTVVLNGQVLLEGYDYSVSYADNRAIGTATVTVTGKGGYSGSSSKTFQIIEPQPVEASFKSLSYNFSNSREGFGYPQNYVIPLESYERVFSTMLAKYYFDMNARSGSWGGNCFGMSASSGMMNTVGSGLDAKSFNASARALYDLDSRDRNSSLGMSVTQLVESMQVAQYDSNVQAAYRNNTNLDSLAAAVRKVAAGSSPVLVCVWGPMGGHALLAYEVENLNASTSLVRVYDSNYPGDNSRAITLTADSSGKFAGWSYSMNGFDYRSGKSGCSIAYVPYETYAAPWRTRNARTAAECALDVNAGDFDVVRSDGKNVATVRDGVLKASASGVHQGKFLSATADGTNGSGASLLYLPQDESYRIVNRGESAKQLSAGIVDNEQRASVTTDANEVTFTISDKEEVNLVDVAVGKGDAYSITLESQLASAAGQELVELSGVGNGSLLSMGMAAGNCIVVNSAATSMYVNGQKVDIGNQVDIAGLDISLAYDSCDYDGKAHEPVVTVKNGGHVLAQGDDYVVVYTNNVAAGTAKATVYGIGNYGGKVEKAFTVKSKEPSGSAVSAGGGKSASTAKAKPKITLKKSSKTVKAKAAKKKAQSFKVGAKSTSGGKLSYKIVKKNPNMTFKAGTATLKKGSYKRGKTFSMKVKVTSAGKGKFAQGSKTFTVKFKVQ